MNRRAQEVEEWLKEALLEAFLSRYTLVRGLFRRRKGAAAPTRPRPGGFPDGVWRGVVKQVLSLHDSYTSGGGGAEFGHEENPIHEFQAGYQFYYLPRNFFRVSRVLAGLPWSAGCRDDPLRHLPLADDGSLSILDLGCGTGAFSLALLSRLAQGAAGSGPPPPVSLTLVDQGRALIELAEANIRAFALRALPETPLRIESRYDGVENFLSGSAGRRGSYSIAGSAMMLNELGLLGPRRSKARAVRFVAPLRRLPAEGGLLLLAEPGTRKGYMNLMAVREQCHDMPLLYPCPHQQPCPLWDAKVRRWCHSTESLPRPFFFDELLRRPGGLGFSMRELNICGLALQSRAGGPPKAPFESRSGFRIVSAPLPPRPAGKGQSTQPAGPGGAEGEVVLQCTPGGKLREVPAAPFGKKPRGLWLEEPAGSADQPKGGGQWKNRG